MAEHVVIVAMTVEAADRDQAMRTLEWMLVPPPDPRCTGWWFAEDDRIDGNDNDSAVFVPQGSQGVARAVLSLAGVLRAGG